VDAADGHGERVTAGVLAGGDRGLEERQVGLGPLDGPAGRLDAALQGVLVPGVGAG
jgi:hypothetical protein